MLTPAGYFWKKVPVIRVLLPFGLGIWLQWNTNAPVEISCGIAACCLAMLSFLLFIPLRLRFRYSRLQGGLVCILFIAVGASRTVKADIRQSSHWFGGLNSDSAITILVVQEPLVDKPGSLKAEASIVRINNGNEFQPATGEVILYFQKDSSIPRLSYGSTILVRKPLIPISNSGNPGGFDFRRYCLFHGITHQVYLRATDFYLLGHSQSGWYHRKLYSLQNWVIRLLRRYVPGNREAGMAEALLIGYKNDLDKDLVQSYSNTGVVHVIAISGLHIGLIYWLLLISLRPFRQLRIFQWLQPLLVIAGLWGFSLLAGAQASVLRSALMFSCLVLGQALNRKTAAYNSLAFSAFILLCYQPFWLWDVGFQLSYAAVLSIMIFQRTVDNWFYFRNRIIATIWQLCAVTIAAQLLTLPFTLYYFHQLPVYFLVANILAVPLSSLIVLGEILLSLGSSWEEGAHWLGGLLAAAIKFMNFFVARIEMLPMAKISGIQCTAFQAFLLVLFLAGLGGWLIERLRWGMLVAQICLLGITGIYAVNRLRLQRQELLVVYNIPGKLLVDLIDGTKATSISKPEVQQDSRIRNYCLIPARNSYGAHEEKSSASLLSNPPFYCWRGTKILIIDQDLFVPPQTEKLRLDLLIISRNPKLFLPGLLKRIEPGQVVFSGTLSPKKLSYWKKDCDSLGIPWHYTGEKGAFVMRVN